MIDADPTHTGIYRQGDTEAEDHRLPRWCGDEPDTYWETFVLNVVSRTRGDGPI